jgi:hypothetical protein
LQLAGVNVENFVNQTLDNGTIIVNKEINEPSFGIEYFLLVMFTIGCLSLISYLLLHTEPISSIIMQHSNYSNQEIVIDSLEVSLQS